jgi:hypothetical protein
MALKQRRRRSPSSPPIYYILTSYSNLSLPPFEAFRHTPRRTLFIFVLSAVTLFVLSYPTNWKSWFSSSCCRRFRRREACCFCALQQRFSSTALHPRCARLAGLRPPSLSFTLLFFGVFFFPLPQLLSLFSAGLSSFTTASTLTTDSSWPPPPLPPPPLQDRFRQSPSMKLSSL